MIKKIYEVYQNPKDLIDICTFRELKFLKLYLEKDKKKNIKRNKKFLTEFKAYMKNQKLSPKTIKKHLNNMELYLNEYLTYYGVTKMEDRVYEINMFLGDFFIRKCLWSSVSSIKENASSIKKIL